MMSPDTEPETEITITPLTSEVLASLLERHHLPALQSVEPVAADDPYSLILNGEMVLLLNAEEPDQPLLAKEASIYRNLARLTKVPCPEVLALDTTREIVPYDALILSRIAGTNAATIWHTLGEDVREAISEEAGRICGEIHRLQWPAYGDFTTATGTFGPYPRWIDMLLSRLERVAYRVSETGALPQMLVDAVVTEINDGDSLIETASPPVLVHGDIHTGNLLIEQRDGSWHVAALLDWERALTADAAWEFAGLWMRTADREPLQDAFIYGYRERHPPQIDLQSRIHLYRLLLHLEGAVGNQVRNPDRRAYHEAVLRRMLRRR
jgi:aminoglycoside phosphotransferase (APT) family kinase protein